MNDENFESKLFIKYKSTYKSGLIDLTIHVFFMSLNIYLMYYFKNHWLSIFTTPLLSLFFVRSFIIFHDCCHNSYTPSKRINYIISNILGVIVFTSPNWIIDHNTHHLTNGNIENKENYFFNETIILTKKQYVSYNKKNKNIYYFYKNPYIFFTIVPLIYFLIAQRFIYIYKKYKRPLKYKKTLFMITFDHLINNFGILYKIYFVFKYNLFYHYIVSLFLSTTLLFMKFHNQHSYNPSYVVNDDKWSQKDSGIYGSAFTQIPYYLKYFFMGIEYHHIHHMNSKIPGYNLQKYHEEVILKSKLFDNVHKIEINDFFNNLWLVLYDNERNKYITFQEI
jgi:omega-6 fatty acid desaturase (delta-12 desaturase)